MRIVAGLLLIGIGFVWGAFWSAGAGMTTETGVWNSSTYALMGVAPPASFRRGSGFI